MKIQLIRPPLDDWYGKGQFEELLSVPVGLCLLAEKVKDSCDVEVRDGMNLSLDETIAKIDPDADLVAVTDIYAYHQNAMAVLKAAKENGSKTIVGGTNVNHLADRILDNHEYVDFVNVGDGHHSFPLLIAGEDPEKIPNLVYRKHGIIIQNERKYLSPEIATDLSMLKDWQMFDVKKGFPITSVRGCIKAAEGERCDFCSIDDILKLASPKYAWSAIGSLHEKYGTEYYWEGGDSFIVGNYPERMLAARPSELSHIKFKIFSSPQQITPEMVETLVALNVVNIFIGIESANDQILKNVGKGFTTADIERALDYAKDSPMNFHFPFIYGLTGETNETAERTYQFAKDLVENYPVPNLISSLPVVLPGTKLFQKIRDHPQARAEYSGDLDKDDFFDYKELAELHMKYFTEVDFERMKEYVDKTKTLLPEGHITSFYVND